MSLLPVPSSLTSTEMSVSRVVREMDALRMALIPVAPGF